jgi:large subunit ribosomal protein L17
MVTLGRKGSLAARRRAISVLCRPERVATLFDEIAPSFEQRDGGYTRIMRLGRRAGDGSEMALLEWVGLEVPDKKKPTKKEEKS